MAKIVINKSHLFHNLEQIEKKINDKNKIAVVLKDNAYGHGLLEIAQLCHEYGIKNAVVRTFKEAESIVTFFDNEKAKKALEQNQVQQRLKELKNALASEKFNKLALPVEDGIRFIKIEDIYYCEADAMYTNFYLKNNEKILISKPLKYFTDLLENKDLFFKSHRSYMVNLKYLQKIVKKEGTYIELENSVRVPVSKDKREDLMNLITNL